MTTTPCMGGNCADRQTCGHYTELSRVKPVGRLCAHGITDAFVKAVQPGRRRWSVDEKLMLRELFPQMPVAQVAARMGLKPSQIINQAHRLGLKLSKTALAKIRAASENQNRPPTKAQAMQALLLEAGVKGVGMPEIGALFPGCSPEAQRVTVSKLRAAGKAYSIPRQGFTRYFDASVSRTEAEALHAELARSEKANESAIKVTAHAAIRAARAAAKAVISAEKAKAKTARRRAKTRMAAQSRRAVTLSSKLFAARVARKTDTDIKAAFRAMPGIVTAKTVVTIAPTPLPRFAPTEVIRGEFASMRPGQYACGPTSCSARVAA